MPYQTVKLAFGAIATIGLYSVLYRENRFYRFWEHVFLGLASGWALVALWTDTLKSSWWDKMLGASAEHSNSATMGYWLYAILLPIGIMGYFVFNRKHNWISRIPIGIILGLYSGQQFNAWLNQYGPQIDNTLRPIIPTTGQFFVPPTTGLPPAEIARLNSEVYGSQALSNLIFVITVVSVLSYFLFSFDVKNPIIARLSLTGRWLLMIGFGAIFGSTVMMRFTLLIDRMYFVWIEFIWKALLHR